MKKCLCELLSDSFAQESILFSPPKSTVARVCFDEFGRLMDFFEGMPGRDLSLSSDSLLGSPRPLHLRNG